LELKGYNVKHLVKQVSQERQERRDCLQAVAKAADYCQSTIIPAAADDAASIQLIE